MYKLFLENTGELSPGEQSAAAHSLLRRSLAQHFDMAESDFEIKKDGRGAPYIAGREDIFVSLTHTKGLVACAFADGRVGVDAEVLSDRRKSVERRVFTSDESRLIDLSDDENAAFFTLWTLKESWLKAIGTGFSGNAKDVEFFSLTNPVRSDKAEFDFFTERYGECIVSLCVEKNDGKF